MSGDNQSRPNDGHTERDRRTGPPGGGGGRPAAPYPGSGRPAAPNPGGGAYDSGGPPLSAYPGWSVLATANAPRPSRARTLAVGGAAAFVIALLGAPLGVLWAAVAPAVPLVKADKGAIPAQPEPEQFIAADGWFTLLGLGLGALVAITVWLVLRRYRGLAGIAVAAVGMVGAAILAWRLGREIGLAEFHRLLDGAPPGMRLEKPPDLRAGGFVRIGGLVPVPRGVLLAPAFGAAVTYTLLAGWSRHPHLRPGGWRPPLSWGWPRSQAPAAVPAPPAPDAGEPPRG